MFHLELAMIACAVYTCTGVWHAIHRYLLTYHHSSFLAHVALNIYDLDQEEYPVGLEALTMDLNQLFRWLLFHWHNLVFEI
ncbi:hypothetical protein BDD12DRAFT_868424, partial [Trichophaea hybrida]